jgi:glycosyltransferase involved in cell wall biosynthesis
MSEPKLKVAVILSTYNAPDRLEPTLVGYAAQDYKDFEIVVADDGSRADTQALIERVANRHRLRVTHVWHPDDGFRKCRIMNQAILATDAQYLIFSDGDCIPRADFVATHISRAQPRRFLSGGYFKLPRETSAKIDEAVILDGRATDPKWLVANGVPRTLKLSKLWAHGWQEKWLNALTPTRASWNGHNASGWRSDIFHVNGFDERMVYGAEDREFGERLMNAGIRGVQIRYSAICVHLYHDRPYRTAEGQEHNRRIRRNTLRQGLTWTEHGIVKAASRESARVAEARPAPDVTIRRFEP